MTVHVSVRLAWHLDGWNGRICNNPAANTFCVGQYSYPEDMIGKRRVGKTLEDEIADAGRACSQLSEIPPCVYSINAFGSDAINANSEPPEFFADYNTTSWKRWKMPPCTASIWPYEAMYSDEAKSPQGYWDNDKRLEAARNYFAQLEENRSLIFYYANYSNPFSEDEQRRYVLVGLGRLKKIGDELFYDDASQRDKAKFGQGFVWQRNLTSHYPDQGLRIPYHVYRERPEVLQSILLVPDNPRLFKYGTRHISDDDALDLVERFLEVAATLRDLNDTSEDWVVRLAWLQSLIAELWQNRGLYPGLPKVLDYLEFETAIPFFKARVLAGKEQETRDGLFDFLEGRANC